MPPAFIYPQGTIAVFDKGRRVFRLAVPVGSTPTPILNRAGLTFDRTIAPTAPPVRGNSGGGPPGGEFELEGQRSPRSSRYGKWGNGGRGPLAEIRLAPAPVLRGTVTHSEVQPETELPPNVTQVSKRDFAKAIGSYHWYTDLPVVAPVAAGVVGLGLLAKWAFSKA